MDLCSALSKELQVDSKWTSEERELVHEICQNLSKKKSLGCEHVTRELMKRVQILQMK